MNLQKAAARTPRDGIMTVIHVRGTLMRPRCVGMKLLHVTRRCEAEDASHGLSHVMTHRSMNKGMFVFACFVPIVRVFSWLLSVRLCARN